MAFFPLNVLAIRSRLEHGLFLGRRLLTQGAARRGPAPFNRPRWRFPWPRLLLRGALRDAVLTCRGVSWCRPLRRHVLGWRRAIRRVAMVFRLRLDRWLLAGRLLRARGGSVLRHPSARRIFVLALSYLLLLLLCEGLAIATAEWVPALEIGCYGLLGLMLTGHAILGWDRPWRGLPLSLAFAPALRLLLLSLGPAGCTGLYPFLALLLPILAALVAVLRALGLVRLSPAFRPAALAGFLGIALLLTLGLGLGLASPAVPGEARAGLAANEATAAHPPAGGKVLAGEGGGRTVPWPLDLYRPVAPAAYAMRRAMGAGSAGTDGPAGTERLPPRGEGIAGAAGRRGAASSLSGRVLWPYVPLGAALSTRAATLPRGAVVLSRPNPAPDGMGPEPGAPSATPPPLPPGCPTQGYDNLYPRGVCTWYAKERRPDLPSFAWDYGLAMYWPQAARLCGFRVDTEPAVGAVIVFPPGANGADAGGHVGYVEEVGTDYLLISECNVSPGYPCYEEPMYWVGGYFCANRRIDFAWLDSGVRFIHGREE